MRIFVQDINRKINALRKRQNGFFALNPILIIGIGYNKYSMTLCNLYLGSDR